MASRFWVGGTGTWDSSTTTHWAATSGGAGGQSVPGSADTVTFDASSGGGTVTVNTTVNVSSIAMGTFTGTLDFSANNNNVTLSTFNGSGTGTRTLNMGNGTWTITSTLGVTVWTINITTNLTFNANSSTLVFSAATTATRTFTPGSLTYATVQIAANSSGGPFSVNPGTTTIGTMTIAAGSYVQFASGLTITNAFTWTGTSSSPLLLTSNSVGNGASITVASGSPTIQYAGIRDLNFVGGATFTATNSFDNGHNSGITITGPSVGGGSSGFGVVGG